MTSDGASVQDGPGLALPQTTGSRRINWAAMPKDATAAIERLLGSTVVDAVSQPGGFSAGLAARVSLADGRRVFVKAADTRNDPAAAAFHRREITISERLSANDFVPPLLDSFDDGTWVALVFQEIPGRLPAQPWHRDELDRVLAAVTDMTHALTPSPVDQLLLAAPRLGGWQALTGEQAATKKLRTLSPWAADHLEQLVALEEDSAHVLAGSTLLHGDLYPFNIMLTSDRVFVIDWPHAWIGAPHCDVVTLLSGIQLSGMDPQEIAERHPLTCDLDPNQINVVLAMHAGFLLRIATSVGPEADRNLVDMVTALGLASLHWLRNRL